MAVPRNQDPGHYEMKKPSPASPGRAYLKVIIPLIAVDDPQAAFDLGLGRESPPSLAHPLEKNA
jgi:hypothetical protein